MGHTSTVIPISREILTGREPLSAQRFRALEDDVQTNRQTELERCLAMLNGKLLSRNFTADCSYSLVHLGPYERSVVEEALRVMREDGGWSTAEILRYDEEKHLYTIRFHH